MFKRTVFRFIIAALAAALAPVAFAHAVLKEASPPADAVLDTTPAQIRLQFNEALEAGFSKITLTDGRGTALTTPAAKVEPGQPDTLVLGLPVLAAGTWQVHWSTLTRDGHRVKGDYAFRVK
ncbi:copper resistance protein CopC [Actimicrobium sp. CCI2.3]|uniref:copper resistance CopC family protein n=1 Tax=Actimicrobium sp. CCI2.3 TaxID=3048616 RepID=UPI002AB48C02|nr:copper resistance protein CopC [Actimicrobium sp. CCI2.3]MDY7573246.1 copper resistance protein CopC [Actimicrobium sp. CCI2.3]MEB0022880.1 copper resistance protein CopC [Actimicrobium sp. CCI2.3]